MQPKKAPRKKDPVPILFSSPPVSPLKSPEKTSFGEEARPEHPAPENAVYVYLQFVETNLVKVKTKTAQQEQQALTTELSFKKRDHAFLVNKDDIKLSKYLRSNYLPADDIIEIPVSVNVNLPHAKFPTLERIIRAIVEKEKKNAPSYPLEVNTKNCVEMFSGACLLGLDDLAIFIYQVVIKPKLNLKLLIGLLLISLECSIAKLYMELYHIFREYWLASDGWADPSPIAYQIMEGKDDGTSIDCDEDMYSVYLKEELEFSFPVSTLKRPFDIYRRDLYRKCFDPEQKMFAMHIRRRRNIEDNDGIFESNYPHKYYLIDKEKNEVILTAIRLTEYGDFYLFGKDENNQMQYGGNYVGLIVANAWGTEFEVYDEGVDEDTLDILPKYICAQRTKIATIKYDSNILGDVPREIKVDFTNFADKKPAQLVPMPPKYDQEKDCYTLNFYGKAQVASARNFILTFPHDRDNIIFLQGKTAKDMFNVEFRHPLNFVQMFSISLASIGKKFCVS